VPALTISLKANQKPFNDIRVRKAMQMAIDINSIHKDFFGYTNDLLIPGIWNPSLKDWVTYGTWDEELMAGYTFNPEGAKKLLTEAGYPDGFSFECIVDPMSDMDLYVLAQSQLAAVGIEMELSQVGDMQEAFGVQGNRDDPRQYSNIQGQIVEIGMAQMFVDPTGPRYSIFEEDEAVNEAFASKFAELANANTMEEQTKLAREADLMFAAQHWQILLGGVLNTEEFYSARMHGFSKEMMNAFEAQRFMVPRLWVS
jgi:ABC-type transport system substrate-binding protein